jgi:murein DD-endopeptidase MepM/ murein hydrolase activator NlpD
MRKEHAQVKTALLCMLLLIAFLGGSWWYLKGPDVHAEIVKVPPTPQVRTASIAPLTIPTAEPVSCTPIRKVYTVDQGDTFYEILKENGVPGEEALSIIRAVKHVFNTARIHAGNTIVLVFSPDNQRLIELHYEISDLKELLVTVSDDKIRARRVAMDQEERVIPDTEIAPPAKPEQTAPAPGTLQPSTEKRPTAAPGLRQVEVTIKKGHNLFDILRERGISGSEIDAFAKSARKVYNLRDIKPGNTMTVWLTQNKPAHMKRLTYEIDDTNYLDVTSDKNTFNARIRTLQLEVRYERANGTISNSLYESARANGLNPEIVMELTDIYAWNINFFSDIQPGDTYSVLYEKYYVKDEFKGYGRVVAATFVNQDQRHVAIYYQNERKGIQGYFDEKGKPLKKMFLKAPLNFRRISSCFTQHRMHPIFNVYRPHLGVDYAAPAGTPVCSLGTGQIAFRGWSKGFGNTIRVKHPEGYISHYAHLSRFAKGLAVGKKVDQGDVIGFVGSTGYSTGPHLDFRMSHCGKFVNPLALKSVNGPALQGRALSDFKNLTAKRLAMLSEPGIKIAVKSQDKTKQPSIKIAAGG